ncbi:hypothetical protein [Flavobacterium oreochromis]|nr:hypothetical protein [Flavobacterium oreochromis]
MAKLYTKTLPQFSKMMPEKETVHFILSYSKALKIIKADGKNLS